MIDKICVQTDREKREYKRASAAHRFAQQSTYADVEQYENGVLRVIRHYENGFEQCNITLSPRQEVMMITAQFERQWHTISRDRHPDDFHEVMNLLPLSSQTSPADVYLMWRMIRTQRQNVGISKHLGVFNARVVPSDAPPAPLISFDEAIELDLHSFTMFVLNDREASVQRGLNPLWTKHRRLRFETHEKRQQERAMMDQVASHREIYETGTLRQETHHTLPPALRELADAGLSDVLIEMINREFVSHP